MKRYKAMYITVAVVASLLVFGFTYRNIEEAQHKKRMRAQEKGCVFRTVMGEESSNGYSRYKTPEEVQKSVGLGLSWITGAQQKDGGWGAGTHMNQRDLNPHSVATDPATTSMVAMALLRSGSTLKFGKYQTSLQKALQYLLNAVETSGGNSKTITNETGTQIQVKLGEKIDVILAAQFLSNILPYTDHDPALQQRTRDALQQCVKKIENNIDSDGSIAGSGWAGVLQSALATSALEAADANNVAVAPETLQKSRDYQKGNLDVKTGEAKTEKGAGVVLYSVSGSARATAKEARKVKEDFEEAKKNGKIARDAELTAQNLAVIGYSEEEALDGMTTYEVYQSAKVMSQNDEVMNGFGSNGGEEFLSYLQTGEGMIIGKDDSWQKWYDDISGRLLKIQNQDGSWNGHHCITSPVFCTATCLLILSINNDIEKLTVVGNRK
jgi:hypothetical protein